MNSSHPRLNQYKVGPARLARHQSLPVGNAQHELKYFMEQLHRQPLADVAEAGVIRSLCERHTQESLQGQAVGTPPGDSTLAGKIFDVSYQQHAVVDPRRNAETDPTFVLLVVELARRSIQ